MVSPVEDLEKPQFNVPSFTKRTSAWTIDLLLFSLVCGLASLVPVRGPEVNLSHWPVNLTFRYSLPILILQILWVIFAFYLVRVYPAVKYGWTPGKKLCGLEIIDIRDSGLPNPEEIWPRMLLILLGDIFGSVVAATAYLDPERRHLADHWCHTRVVDISERKGATKHFSVKKRPLLTWFYILVFCLPIALFFPKSLREQAHFFHLTRHPLGVIYHIDLAAAIGSGLQLPQSPVGPGDANGTGASDANGSGSVRPFTDPAVQKQFEAEIGPCEKVQLALGAASVSPVADKEMISRYCACFAVNFMSLQNEQEDLGQPPNPFSGFGAAAAAEKNCKKALNL